MSDCCIDIISLPRGSCALAEYVSAGRKNAQEVEAEEAAPIAVDAKGASSRSADISSTPFAASQFLLGILLYFPNYNSPVNSAIA